MGLLELSLHKEYLTLINALTEYYYPLFITGDSNGMVIMKTDRCRNIQNLKIKLYVSNPAQQPIECVSTNSKKQVVIKMSYTINGKYISLQNSYPYNGNQRLIFNSIVENELINTTVKINEEEFTEDTEKYFNINTLNLEQNKNIILRMYYNVSNKIHDKDDEISKLNLNQKEALLIIAIRLCHYSPARDYLYLYQFDVLLYLALKLGMEENSLIHYLSTKGDYDDEVYIEIIKTIHLDIPFIYFTAACNTLLDFVDIVADTGDMETTLNESHIYTAYQNYLHDFGFSEYEINHILNGKYYYKFKSMDSDDTDTKNSLFIEDWSLLNFAREYGPKMQVVEFHNRDGEVFHKCRFTNQEGEEIYASFYSRLGELSPMEISRRKEELKVGLMENGKYYLHDDNIEPWEEIDLGKL